MAITKPEYIESRSDKMTDKQTTMRFRILMFTFTAIAIIFAFVHSAMPSDISSEESEGLAQLIYRFLENFGIDLSTAEFITRKLAHFTEYAFIGAFSTCTAYSFNRFKPHIYLPHILFTGLFTAVIDETIQLFSEGRAGMVQDVLIDFSGVCFGMLIMLAAFAIYRKKKYQGSNTIWKVKTK